MTKPPPPIPFIDLKTQGARVRARVEARWRTVLDRGAYILGPEVTELEERLAAFCGAGHAVACSSGTDALWLPLVALRIGAGDAVFLPSWTFVGTAGAVRMAGATPVFVDIDPATFTIAPASLEAAVTAIAEEGRLVPRAVIPVDMFGMTAAYGAVHAIARRHGLTVLADAAQSFGATLGGRRVGSLAHATATSFYPSKPLGCWGDGGAVFTDDPDLAARLRAAREHGHEDGTCATNARLDTLQAVVLLEKLLILEDELRRRQEVAEGYTRALADVVTTPRPPADSTSAWAHYTIQTERRDELAAGLKARGIPTQVYYREPLHLHEAFAGCPRAPGGLPVTERLRRRVLSLPMHPYLDQGTQARICAAVRDVLA